MSLDDNDVDIVVVERFDSLMQCRHKPTAGGTLEEGRNTNHSFRILRYQKFIRGLQGGAFRKEVTYLLA